MRSVALLTATLAAALATASLADEAPTTSTPPATRQGAAPARNAAANRAQATREFLGLGVAPDQTAAARGRPTFEAQCSACHGQDARGGIGPNLIYSSVVLDDDHGEKLVPFLKVGRPEKGMPGFASLTDAQLKDVAEFLHLQVENVANRGTYDNANNILTGDAKRGEAYVAKNCAGCHSIASDLKGIGAKYRPLDLQRNWVFPPREPADGSRALRAIVTTPEGVVKGRIRQVDDFRIVVIEDGGAIRPFARGPNVKVEILDPLAPHKEIARTLKDRDMTDVTTYLAGLK